MLCFKGSSNDDDDDDNDIDDNNILIVYMNLLVAAQIAKEVEKAEKTRTRECLSLTEASTSVCIIEYLMLN